MPFSVKNDCKPTQLKEIMIHWGWDLYFYSHIGLAQFALLEPNTVLLLTVHLRLKKGKELKPEVFWSVLQTTGIHILQRELRWA